ncbi:hypothetical protein JK361_26150 [Streptomyces sp. 5-8]|uniref:Integrase n=1 Tax=Streptomyces musisoli TaxID=2802280 RepID=A0ABS1P6Z4_9ACTN|nr:hypothetical protein [Streptomyces musisoli]MBL1108029.1 hypothetical protein [Streptomyces musisoli]
MKRRTHHAREQTRNDRAYVIRYTFPLGPGQGRRTADFHTADKAQAYRRARDYEQRGWLTSLALHHGKGRWEDLTATVQKTRKEVRR